jgi:hypothetical protein
MTVSNMERIIDVASGKMHVKFSRTMRISPGSRPRGIPVFAIKYTTPPMSMNSIPTIINQRARENTFRTAFLRVLIYKSRLGLIS